VSILRLARRLQRREIEDAVSRLTTSGSWPHMNERDRRSGLAPLQEALAELADPVPSVAEQFTDPTIRDYLRRKEVERRAFLAERGNP